jgi:hypothetical protein
MKTLLRTLAALVAVGLGVLLVPVAPAEGEDCDAPCNTKRTTCDATCIGKQQICIAQCGLPISPGYPACFQKCNADASVCSLECQGEQEVCKVKCKAGR